MYNLQSLIGKVVTIKSHKGDEYVAKLAGFNDEGTILTVFNPKIVVISGDSVVLIPFALTAKCDEVFLHINQIFTILETMDTAAAEYESLIDEEKRLESQPLDDDEDDDDDDDEDD